MKKWSELTIVEKVKILVLLASVALLTVLVVQNYKVVALTLFFWEVKISLIVLIAISGFLGFLISFLKGSIKIKRIKKEMAVLQGLKKGAENLNPNPNSSASSSGSKQQ